MVKNTRTSLLMGMMECTCYVTIADHENIEYFRTDLPDRSWQLAQYL